MNVYIERLLCDFWEFFIYSKTFNSIFEYNYPNQFIWIIQNLLYIWTRTVKINNNLFKIIWFKIFYINKIVMVGNINFIVILFSVNNLIKL